MEIRGKWLLIPFLLHFICRTFGLALLAVLTSCLLQLVGTSYYFLIEITWKKDVFSFFLQVRYMLPINGKGKILLR